MSLVKLKRIKKYIIIAALSIKRYTQANEQNKYYWVNSLYGVKGAQVFTIVYLVDAALSENLKTSFLQIKRRNLGYPALC